MQNSLVATLRWVRESVSLGSVVKAMSLRLSEGFLKLFRCPGEGQRVLKRMKVCVGNEDKTILTAATRGQLHL